ncbi:MAG: NAD(P)H-hydrate dehydratase [Phycisphaerales bacterium]|nr:NAD(P)H-hydrate dehydratase [Phycisphaerales bacterium]
MAEPRLPARDPRGHKGTFGTVVVVGGCAAAGARMVGASALSALGALRAGAGLAKLLCPEPVLAEVIAMTPSATGRGLPVDPDGEIIPHDAAALLDAALASSEVLAIGPGFGTGPGSQALSLRAVQQEDRPVVVDADAINCLAGVPELWRDFHAMAVLTPHPGEFRRLAGPLRIRQDPTDDAERPAAAEAMAQRLGCVVVLKGAGAVVSDGQRTWVCRHGHACLATAGTGDVLTGVIAGIIAQFVRPLEGRPETAPEMGRSAPRAGSGRLDLFDAARAGVLAHALAGELWAERHGASAGLLATELAELIPACGESIRDR